MPISRWLQILARAFSARKQKKNRFPPRRTHASDRAAEAGIGRARLSVVLVGLVIVYGTIGYIWVEKLTPLDALYQTVITIFGIGFGEIDHPFGPQGRAFTISLVVGGTGVALYALGSGIELLISEQFSHWRQRRKMQRDIDRTSDHFIVCGYGRIGRQLAQDFRENNTPFCVVDSDPERTRALLEENIPHVEGDATLDETLLEAGIERARGLIGALNTDAANVMTIVSARGLNPRLFIVARAAVPEAEKKLYRAGADEVVSPYVVGARRISLSLLRPAVSGFLNAVLYDRDLQAEMNEIIVAADSPMCNQTLSEAGLAHGDDILPLAMMRGGRLMFSPLPSTRLQAGDTLIIVTPTASFRIGK
jgi:voltage-gated potassium channel